MRFGRHKHKRLRVVLAAMVATLLLLLAEPLWFPWVLKPLARQNNLGYEAYERVGWRRFRLHEVKGEFGDATFRAHRLEAPLALPFLGWRFLPRLAPEAEKVRIELDDWEIAFSGEGLPGESPADESEPDSASAVLDLIERELPRLRPWLPEASLRNGRVRVGAQQVLVPAIVWDGSRLTARLSWPSTDLPVDVALAFPTNRLGELSLVAPRWDLRITASVDRAEGAWRLNGRLGWRENIVELNADFGPEGFPPIQATARGQDLRVPLGVLATLGRTEIQGGALELNWRTNSYSFQADVMVRAEHGLTNGPASVSVGGRGDLERLRLERFSLSATGIEARLSKPITLNRDLELEHEGATLDWEVDLAAFALPRSRGALRGELAPGTGAPLRIPVAFRVAGEGIDTPLGGLSSVNLAGDFAWPNVRLTETAIRMTNGPTLEISVTANLASRSLTSASWRLAGPLPSGWIPRDFDLSPVLATGTLQGDFATLQHSGKIAIERIKLPALQPLNGEFSWQGHGLASVDFALSVQAPEARLELEGTGSLDSTNPTLSGVLLRGVTLSRGGTNLLTLLRPCELNLWRTPADGDAFRSPMACKWSPLALAGERAFLRLAGNLAWPKSGDVSCLVTNLHSSVWSGFLENREVTVFIPRLKAEATWDRGPAEVDVELELTATRADWPEAGLAGRVRSVKEGLRVESLTLSLDHAPLVDFSGEFPVRFRPAQWPEVLDLDRTADLNLDFSVAEDATAWTGLAKATGLVVENGVIEAEVSGPVEQPVGRLRLEAARLTFPERLGTNIPPIEALQLTLCATPAKVELLDLNFRILEQPVNAVAALPLEHPEGTDWWRHSPKPLLDQASGRLLAENIRLVSLTNLFPTLSIPAGELSIDVNLTPNRGFQGTLRVTNAVSGALPELGVLRDIHARVVFTNDTAVIEHGEARLSGQPLFLSGRMRLLTNDFPTGSIRIVGTNLSLARNPQLFLRGTLDVSLSREPGATPVLGGLVILTNSLVMPDLLDGMVDITRPEKRPPYFSVPQAPFADWRLDLRVEGQRFARVVSPFFKGVVSLGLHLGGTLGKPIALGDATVNSGRVLFPFGELDVELGRVSLTQESPFRPELAVKASGMSFGYSVKMDIQGPLDSFNMGLSAVPPLSSKEILLMLAAGEVPRNDFSFTQTDKASRIGYYFGSKAINNLLGQDPSSDRLEIRTGEYVDDRGGLTYSVEYRLTDRLYAVGIYDRFRTFNAGLKFRIYSK